MVRTGAVEDQAAVVHAIVLAFAADPIARWCWPDPHSYLSNMGEFTRAFAGGSFDRNCAYFTAGYAGAALWLPPDVHPDEEKLGAIADSTRLLAADDPDVTAGPWTLTIRLQQFSSGVRPRVASARAIDRP